MRRFNKQRVLSFYETHNPEKLEEVVMAVTVVVVVVGGGGGGGGDSDVVLVYATPIIMPLSTRRAGLQVDSILIRYQGREEKMFSALYRKYNVAPTVR